MYFGDKDDPTHRGTGTCSSYFSVSPGLPGFSGILCSSFSWCYGCEAGVSFLWRPLIFSPSSIFLAIPVAFVFWDLLGVHAIIIHFAQPLFQVTFPCHHTSKVTLVPLRRKDLSFVKV